MSNKTSNNIDALEGKIEALLELNQNLTTDNAVLKQQLQELKVDRSHLVEQKETVRHQVEGMISRLKSMEVA